MKRRDMRHGWDKVRSEGCCRVCGSTQIVDAAHVVPRSRVTKGGEDPRNIIPLCRLDHQQFDHGTGLDVLPYLTLDEQSYVVGLVGIAEAFRRTTGVRGIAA